MMTVISIVLFIAAVAPVIILLCMPEHGIGTGEKDLQTHVARTCV